MKSVLKKIFAFSLGWALVLCLIPFMVVGYGTGIVVCSMLIGWKKAAEHMANFSHYLNGE